jgi:hypothetical protein
MRLIKTLLAVTFLFFSTSLHAQFDLNNVSLEVGYGYNGAIGPYNKIFNSNFSGMNHFDVGIRYMFTEKLGAKVFYKLDHFVNDPGGEVGVTYMTVGASGVYNVGKELGLGYLTRDKLGLNAHIDGGVAFAHLIGQNKYEKVGIIGFGIAPMYKISNKFAVQADFTYNYSLKQHYGFDGILLNENYDPEPGSFYNFSVGLIYYIGENKYHSDWY